MSQGRYVLATLSRLVTSRLIYRVCVAVSVILGSRFLIDDPALADTFDVASAATSILMIGSEVGMSMVLMRSGATEDKAKLERAYGTALFIESTAWFILLGICGLGYALGNGLTPMFWLLLLLGINHAFIQYRVPIRSIYRSLYHKERITYIEILDGASKLLGVWLITQLISDRLIGAYAIALLYAVTTVLFIVIYAGFSFRLVWPKFDRTLLSPMLHEGVWFGLQGVIMTVYFEIDKLMMRLFQVTGWVEMADGDIARYGAAARIVIFFLIFHRIGLQVITPYLYAAYTTNIERYKRIVRFSTRYMSAMGIGLGIGIITLAPEIVRIIYGGKFSGIEPALQLFGVFFVIRFIGITSSQIFATTGNQPKRTKQEGVGLVLNIVLDCVFIPFFGYMGGAIATVLTEVTMQSIFFVMTRHLIHDGIFSSLAQIAPALLAGVLMGAGVWYTKTALPVWLTPILGALVYAVLLYLFRFFTPADLKLLNKQPAV